jgi:leucyl-tRNA synthetase
MMIFVNEFSKQPDFPGSAAESFVRLLAPYAPHLAEELWEYLGNNETLTYEEWPSFDESMIAEDELEILIQLKGRPVCKMMMPASYTKEEMEKAALENEEVKKALENKKIIKVIAVPRRLVNLVAN